MNTRKTLLGSAVVVYFIIAFEVLIMISPFAGFFYSVMNPLLTGLAARSSTRWLSAFFLPHMVLPGDPLLLAIRVLGSVLFVLGMVVFLVCAGQIYAAKFRKKGAVLGGLYRFIRHPQYVALAIAGLGLAILWPRFLTVVLWIVMAFIYYALARDEERRMLNSHEITYRRYMEKTGMFLPKGIEDRIAPSSTPRKAVLALVFAAVVLGGALLLRAYTVRHLTVWSGPANASAIAILPEDSFMMEHRMAEVLGIDDIRRRMDEKKYYLVYFLPQNYIMQGMIADTGGDWQLYKQHHSLSMITDWIFNPFGHLRGGHHAMHGMSHAGAAGADSMTRRLIVLSLEQPPSSIPAGLFAINTLRIPQFMADVDVHNLKLLDIKDLPGGSGWGSVPTPLF